jgi:glycosyltransferase involved in cell wall biosynthesis
MQAFDISIVIVNYNTKDFLNKCLISIQNASENLNVETIVFDNNSADGSVDYLMPRYPDVKFIANDENIGFGKANNEAMKIAKGKYVLLLNPDTILQEDTLKSCMILWRIIQKLVYPAANYSIPTALSSQHADAASQHHGHHSQSYLDCRKSSQTQNYFLLII